MLSDIAMYLYTLVRLLHLWMSCHATAGPPKRGSPDHLRQNMLLWMVPNTTFSASTALCSNQASLACLTASLTTLASLSFFSGSTLISLSDSVSLSL